MQSCTEIPAPACNRKWRVFSDMIGLHKQRCIYQQILFEIKWEIMEESTQSINLLSKRVNFFPTADKFYEKYHLFLIPRSCLSLGANFHAWSLFNRNFTNFWKLPLEHYFKFVFLLL